MKCDTLLVIAKQKKKKKLTDKNTASIASRTAVTTFCFFSLNFSNNGEIHAPE